VASYDRFVALLEDRANVEKLLRRIEDLDEEAREREKEEKKRAQAEKRQTNGEKRREEDQRRLAKEQRATDPTARCAAGPPGERPRWRRILGRVRPGRRDTGD
jgi:septal ring factor EnvC (AmiA/AmiB activator)